MTLEGTARSLDKPSSPALEAEAQMTCSNHRSPSHWPTARALVQHWYCHDGSSLFLVLPLSSVHPKYTGFGDDKNKDSRAVKARQGNAVAAGETCSRFALNILCNRSFSPISQINPEPSTLSPDPLNPCYMPIKLWLKVVSQN